jgi:[acyl-carrier-protein] S-malonyltransferase
MTKLAFLFPGQGSQSIGMMSGWADNPAVRDVMTTASNALNENLSDLIAHGTPEQLGLTTNTQPVMLAASYAAYQAWIAAGGQKPTIMAGHSLGEYTAWVASGAMDLADAIRTVRIRANAMQSAVPIGVGSMAAILGLDSNKVNAICAAMSTQTAVVEAVNYNDPLQTVIAGHTSAVTAAIEACKLAGAKRGLILPVSAPFHSSLMRPVGDVLVTTLDKIHLNTPYLPVINNVDVSELTTSIDIKNALVRQSYNPVRWVETIKTMQKQGVTTFIECGPGKVLAGLLKRIAPEAMIYNIFDNDSLNMTLKAMQ